MADDRPRRGDGTYESEVSDEDLVAVFEVADTPVLTASQVSDEVAIGRKAVHLRLQKLHDEGRVERMDVGSRAVVWWPSE